MTARPGPRTSRPRWLANYGPQRGTTYLIHIDPPYQHAHHYTGWTDKPLLERFADHLAGRGALLTRVAVRAGCTLTLARVWPDTTKDREDSLKHRGGARRFCPECGVKPAASRLPSDRTPQRLSLYELERLGTTSDGEALPVITTDHGPALPGPEATQQEEDMFGHQRRAAARAHQRDRKAAAAEADRLLAEADHLDELTERPSYQRQITAERAARVRERIGADLAADARGPAAKLRLDGTGLDAEIGRLAQQYPEPDLCGQPGAHGGQRGLVPGHDGRHQPVHALRPDPGPVPDGAISVLEPEPWESGPDAAAWTPALAGAGSEQRQGPVPGPDPLPRVLTPAESAAPAPDPTRLPDGLPHPNPLLAEHGWATHGGWYVRQPELEHQLEAG